MARAAAAVRPTGVSEKLRIVFDGEGSPTVTSAISCAG
jgi:hypothetical protein